MKLKRRDWLYLIRFGLAMFAYVVVLIVSQLIADVLADNPLRYVVVLLPIIPIMFAFAAFIVYIRQLDELQRRIEFEAFAFSAGITGMITFALGLMESAGLPSVGLIWVFPMLVMFWGFGKIIAQKRYQ